MTRKKSRSELEWDEAIDRLQTPESRRVAAIYHFASVLMGASEALDKIDPPLTAAEAERLHLSITAASILRRLNRGQKLEAVK